MNACRAVSDRNWRANVKFAMAPAPAFDKRRYVDPDTWAAQSPMQDGSWWPEWMSWLNKRSGKPAAPPQMGAPEQGYPPLSDAPGTYVLQK